MLSISSQFLSPNGLVDCSYNTGACLASLVIVSPVMSLAAVFANQQHSDRFGGSHLLVTTLSL